MKLFLCEDLGTIPNITMKKGILHFELVRKKCQALSKICIKVHNWFYTSFKCRTRYCTQSFLCDVMHEHISRFLFKDKTCDQLRLQYSTHCSVVCSTWNLLHGLYLVLCFVVSFYLQMWASVYVQVPHHNVFKHLVQYKQKFLVQSLPLSVPMLI